MEEIARLKAILEDEARLLAEVKADLLRVKEKYGTRGAPSSPSLRRPSTPRT